MNLKHQLDITIDRFISNISNIKDRFSKNKDIDLEDYINQLHINILDAYHSIIIIRHELIQDNLKDLKVTFMEKENGR